jgi:hypothetical protein
MMNDDFLQEMLFMNNQDSDEAKSQADSYKRLKRTSRKNDQKDYQEVQGFEADLE